MMKVERITTAKPNFKELFFLFLIGSMIGTYYEQMLTLINHGVWVSRRALIYGPFNPVYGFGLFVLLVSVANNYQKRKWYVNFMYIALLGGFVEFISSVIEEYFFHARSWDYSSYFLNIGGRTTIPFMLMWGILGTLILYLIYPISIHYMRKIPKSYFNTIFHVMFIFILINSTITIAALQRRIARQSNEPPQTMIGSWLDAVYTDAYLEKIFPNMFIKK